LLVVLALATAACGNSGDDDSDGAAPDGAASGGGEGGDGDGEAAHLEGVPGVTDDEIDFAVFGTKTNNPTGACIFDCYIDGIEAYFAFRNDQGGIDGRELKLTTQLDDELSRKPGAGARDRVRERHVRGVQRHPAGQRLGRHGRCRHPAVRVGIHSAEMNGQDSIFAANGVICGTCTSRTLPYAGTLRDATKIAVLGYGVTQASKDCAGAARDAVELYADETGQEVAFFDDDLAFGLPNGIGPQVSAMKEAGVDFVTGCIDLNGMKTLAQELDRQDMGDVPMLHPNTYDQAFVAEAGDLFEGDLVGVAFRPFEADPGDSALADYFDWMDETGSEPTEVAMQGWMSADLAYQGIVAAGPNFDRAKVIAATNEITHYTAGGLINPIDWSRQHEAPTQDDPASHGYAKECTALVEVHDGEFEVVGDPEAPWSCWDNADRDWSDPEPTDFE
jgi:ABC-type branched-subunit amino acid transport system substrate-binding protein